MPRSKAINTKMPVIPSFNRHGRQLDELLVLASHTNFLSRPASLLSARFPNLPFSSQAPASRAAFFFNYENGSFL
jgi:hypothetical protein